MPLQPSGASQETVSVAILDTKELKKLSKQVRKDIVDQIYTSRVGNIGGCLSAVELLTYLYKEFLNVDPEDPGKLDRDRLILSKGQAAPTYYSLLAHMGFISTKELSTFRQINSRLQTHPEYKKTPGVDFSSGSLGQGLSVGVGMCLAIKKRGIKSRVVVMLGDGELQEGQVWEAIMSANQFDLDNLILVVDNNKLQDFGFTQEVMSLSPMEEKFRSFGWSVSACDGHDYTSIEKAFKETFSSTRPHCIIADTVKGKGVDFMENSPKWHFVQNMSEELHKEINRCLSNEE